MKSLPEYSRIAAGRGGQHHGQIGEPCSVASVNDSARCGTQLLSFMGQERRFLRRERTNRSRAPLPTSHTLYQNRPPLRSAAELSSESLKAKIDRIYLSRNSPTRRISKPFLEQSIEHKSQNNVTVFLPSFIQAQPKSFNVPSSPMDDPLVTSNSPNQCYALVDPRRDSSSRLTASGPLVLPQSCSNTTTPPVPFFSVAARSSTRPVLSTFKYQQIPPFIFGTAAGPPDVALRTTLRAGIIRENSRHPMAVRDSYMRECRGATPRTLDAEKNYSAHKFRKPYKCSFCESCFKNKNEAERHAYSLHVRRYSWSCSALKEYTLAFHDSKDRFGEADVCGFCGEEFGRSGIQVETNRRNGVYSLTTTNQDWENRVKHLQERHKFMQCSLSRKFYRADHFQQHLKHSHASVSGDWSKTLANVCVVSETLA